MSYGYKDGYPCADPSPLPWGKLAHAVKGLSMSSSYATALEPFADRRNQITQVGPPGQERRQFSNGYDELSLEARELGQAIDSYKVMHRRRFITYEEMLSVVKSLGYSK
jgi:hypothetical protein